MVTLQTDRHVFVAGKTRSGKTVLVQSFLNTLPRVVVHDQKGEWGNYAARNHYYIVHTPGELDVLLNKGASRVIYQPAAGDESLDGFDDFCEVVYRQYNLNLVIDEAASYCRSNQVPKWTSALLRLGNGRGVGVISLTQRPRDVSNVLLSESVIIVAFRLQLRTDRTKIIETIGTEVEGVTTGEWRQMIGYNVDPNINSDAPAQVNTVLRTMPKWHFLLYDSESEETHICAPVQHNL